MPIKLTGLLALVLIGCRLLGDGQSGPNAEVTAIAQTVVAQVGAETTRTAETTAIAGAARILGRAAYPGRNGRARLNRHPLAPTGRAAARRQANRHPRA